LSRTSDGHTIRLGATSGSSMGRKAKKILGEK
jgi:hypothetical protein